MSNPWKWGDENQPKPEYKEPTGRYLCCGMDAEMRPFEQGDWVPYNDYANLRMERIHDINQIGGLQEDNARIKTELAKVTEHNEALCERLQDLNSEVFTASCTNARLHSLFANSELENARLKAEVDNSNRINTELLVLSNQQASEVRRLKAEVERLTKAGEMMDRESMSDEYDLNNQTRIINGLLRDKEQMHGKIDRLINAGDLLVFHYTSLGRKFFPDDPLPNSITAWNAAKEGKPSEQKSPSFIEDLGNGVEKHDLLFRYPAKEGKPSV